MDSAHIHANRAAAFLVDARRAATPSDRARHLAAAVEQAVSIVECCLSEATDKDKVRELAWSALPRYRLLKRVRIHEFHRNPLPHLQTAERSGIRSAYMQGPITLSTDGSPGSSVVMRLGPRGIEVHKTGGGDIDRTGGGRQGSEKELCIVDGLLVDEFANDRVGLEQAVTEFLSQVPDFLNAVRDLRPT